jgi:hypothetical protein
VIETERKPTTLNALKAMAFRLHRVIAAALPKDGVDRDDWHRLVVETTQAFVQLLLELVLDDGKIPDDQVARLRRAGITVSEHKDAANFLLTNLVTALRSLHDQESIGPCACLETFSSTVSDEQVLTNDEYGYDIDDTTGLAVPTQKCCPVCEATMADYEETCSGCGHQFVDNQLITAPQKVTRSIALRLAKESLDCSRCGAAVELGVETCPHCRRPIAGD